MKEAVPRISRSRSRGFTLIEALVSLLVLSIGLLGVASLQLSSLRANSSAAARSQATFLAYDIADRMRANRNAAKAGLYDIDFGDATAATPATVAERDLKDWLARVTDALGATAKARVRKLSDSMYEVMIRWDDTHGDAQNTQSGALSATTGTVTFEMRTWI
jgi:type IV pilus assembly protein PilV